jgi:hypothetical protein
MCIDHVRTILDGVIRPGMYKSTYLIPWPHTYPPPSIPFAPGLLQMLSPLYTIYIHASPTFLHLSVDWIPLAHHLSSPFPPSLFFSSIVLTEADHGYIHLSSCIYHHPMLQWSSFDRFFMSHQAIFIVLDYIQRYLCTTCPKAPQSEIRVYIASIYLWVGVHKKKLR